MNSTTKPRPTANAPKRHDVFHVKRHRAANEKSHGDQAWALIAYLKAGGFRAEAADEDAVAVIAVSVHEDAPVATEARMALLGRIVARCRARVGQNQPSLWILPAAFFGHGWTGLDLAGLERALSALWSSAPAGAVLVAGADTGERDQQVWIVRTEANGASVRRILRHRTPLADRRFAVGTLHAAAFVCGEFTGSKTQANGPFFEQTLLIQPQTMLADCDILIDVAHRRVRGSVDGDASPRMVHQRQMEQFSQRGTAVLVHHHGGERREGRAKADCSSAWLVFRGGEWEEERGVLTIQ